MEQQTDYSLLRLDDSTESAENEHRSKATDRSLLHQSSIAASQAIAVCAGRFAAVLIGTRKNKSCTERTVQLDTPPTK